MKTSTNLKLLLPEGKDPVNIGDITGDLETIDTYLANMQTALGDASKNSVVFAQAADRQNIASTETLSTIMGKIAKFFTDIKAAAFCAIANNDTTTAEGYAADARIVKTHGDEIDALSAKASTNEKNISSLNSNLTNLSSTVSGQATSISNLDSANTSRYTENGRIKVYVGSDSKLHFVNRDGADTALNFSPFSLERVEDIVWGCTPTDSQSYEGMLAPNSTGWNGTTYSSTKTSPGGTMSVFEGHVTALKTGHYIFGIVGKGLYEGEYEAGFVFGTNTTSSGNFRAWFVLKLKDI